MRLEAHLVKVLATPIGSFLACVAIKYCEETLSVNTSVVHCVGVSIFHGSSGTLRVHNTKFICRLVTGPAVRGLNETQEHTQEEVGRVTRTVATYGNENLVSAAASDTASF